LPESDLLVPIGAAVDSMKSGVDDRYVGFAQYCRDLNRTIFPIVDPLDTASSYRTMLFGRQVNCLRSFLSKPFLDFDLITTAAQATAFIQDAERNGWATYDFETTGLDVLGADIVLGFSAWTPGQKPVYIPVQSNRAVDSSWPDVLKRQELEQRDLFVDCDADALHPYPLEPLVLPQFRDSFFLNPNIRKSAHNAYFDSLCCWKQFNVFPINGSTCTMLAAHTIDSTDASHPLDMFISNVPEAAGFFVDVDFVRQSTKSYDRIPIQVQAEYCAGDSLVCGSAIPTLLHTMQARKIRHLFELQCGLVNIYSRATVRGVRIDLQYHAALKKEFDVFISDDETRLSSTFYNNVYELLRKNIFEHFSGSVKFDVK
jgi:DNA polymerase I-like protein with 3'-5' exonuclease and polymerase domains